MTRKQKPDPYAVMALAAQKLEAQQGIVADTIIDAAFAIAVQGAIRSAGRQAAARTLLEMALLTADPDGERTERERTGAPH